MAKSAEKLIILADTCRGLLARVYNLTTDHFKRPATLGIDIEKVTKLLIKKFPEHPADLDKLQMELFNKRAQEIVTELADYYLTFIDVLDFSEAALKVLLDMAKTIVAFKFEVNGDLMQFFLDVFVAFIQLHLLVAKAVEPKLMLSAYAKAFHTLNGNTDPGYLRVATYIQNYTNPLERLREEMKEVSLIMGETLITFMPAVLKWSEPQALQAQKVFSIVDDVRDMDKDSGFEKHIELLSVDKFHLWCLYGYLVCPGGLQKENALSLLQMCLRDLFCLPIYRDVSFNIHEEFSKIFDSFVGPNKFKLSKQKKFLKDAREDAVATLDRHRLMRTILRVDLNTLHQVFQEFPRLLAPKFHMVLCALRLARNELLWYFRHLGVPPHKAKKVPKEGDYADQNISELIFLVDSLMETVMPHKRTVQEYYLNKITTVHAPQLAQIIDTFNRQARISHGVSEILSEVLAALSRADDFEAMRLNWYRVSVQLNSQPPPCPTQVALPLSSYMLTVAQHTRAIDRMDSQVRLHGSLGALYFWRAPLSQLLGESITLIGGQPAHWLSFLSVCAHANDNVHKSCPEEQKLIGQSSVMLAEQFLNAIVTRVTQLVFGIGGRMSKLRTQIAPVEVVLRLQRAAAAKNGQTDPLPGYESLYTCRPVIKDLRSYVKILAEICQPLRFTDTVRVFNMEFAPREYVYEAVSNSLRDAIRKISLAERQIQRPTTILTQIRDISYAFGFIDRHVSLNLSDIIRDILVSEFSDPTAGGPGEAIFEEADEKKENQNPSLIHTIASWYVMEIQRFQERGVTYSPQTKSFVSLVRDPNFYPAEYFFDHAELRALCTIAGPAGVRVVERQLLTLISQHVGVVKEILRRNDDALKAIAGRFTERSVWMEQMGRLTDMDKLVKHSILIGTVLKFRKCLHSALEDVTRQRIPMLHDAVKTVFLQYPSNILMDPKLAPVDFLAQDMGLDLDTSDHSLKLCLRKHKNVQSDELLLAHLPELFACSLVAPTWRDSQYLIQTESHNNNVHLVATTVTALVNAFHGIQVTTVVDQPVDLKIQADLERFLRSCCYSILHMTQCKQNEAFSGFPIQSLTVFIEYLVKESGCLTLSILEDFFPFTLLRTNYIQMYEKQAVNGKSYVPVGDDEKE